MAFRFALEHLFNTRHWLIADCRHERIHAFQHLLLGVSLEQEFIPRSRSPKEGVST